MTQSNSASVSARLQAANRRNAQKSTGPKTPEGKARSSRNALKHGVFSVDIVVEGEDLADFAQYRIGLLQRFQPREPLESQFAEHFIRTGWKLRRVQMAELELYADRHRNRARSFAQTREQDPQSDLPELTPGIVLANLLYCTPEFDRFQIYEQRLANQMHRAMNQYRKLRQENFDVAPEDFTQELINAQKQALQETTVNRQNEAVPEGGDPSPPVTEAYDTPAMPQARVPAPAPTPPPPSARPSGPDNRPEKPPPDTLAA